MKRTINIKVKHLVVGLLAASAVVWLYAGLVQPKASTHLAEYRYRQGGGDAKPALFRAIDEAPAAERWRLIREYMIEPGADTPLGVYNVVVGLGSTYTTYRTDDSGPPAFTVEEKLPYLTDYVRRAPVDGYMRRAAVQQAVCYLGLGDPKAALEELASAERRLSKNEAKSLKMMRATLLADRGEDEQALALLEELSADLSTNDADLNGQIAALKAKLLVRQGDVASAREEVARQRKAHEEQWEQLRQQHPNGSGMRSVMLEQLGRLDELLRQTAAVGEPAAVSGTVVRGDGSPMVGVGVFLRHRDDVYHSVLENEPYQTITDASGQFRFDGVLPGSYALYLGFTCEQIDGWTWPVGGNDWIDVAAGKQLTRQVTLRKLMDIVSPVDSEAVTGDEIRFRWEPVDGAATYRIGVHIPLGEGGTAGMTLREGVRETELTVPIEELYDEASLLAFTEKDGKDMPSPLSLLGLANPDNRFYWNVEALDADGRPITRSNGYRLDESTIGRFPFFYVKARELAPEDRLLLDGRLDEALAGYKAAFAANEADRHSLRMIVRVYQGLAAVSDDPRPLEDEALPYLLRMAELYPTKSAWSRVFDYYYSREKWEETNRAYAELARLEGGVNGYTSSVYATSLLHQGRLREAEELFAKAMELDDSHRFVGSYIAVHLYRHGSIDRAAELARRYPERELNPGGPVWAELMAALADEQAQAAAPDAYWRELREQLEWVFAGESESVREWSATTGYTGMKRFVEALLQVD